MDESLYKNCEWITTSPDRLELIVAKDERQMPRKQPLCIKSVSENYEIWYYDRNDMPPLSVRDYTYEAIPRCYSLLDQSSLEQSGIIQLQNQQTLSLMGQGVFIAIVDTGVGETDENGHGSILASIACGKRDLQNEFVGAAPEATLIPIKLAQAPEAYLDFYFIPRNPPVFLESEIMLKVAQAVQIAEEQNAPLAICIGLGSNSGTHTGAGSLELYLNEIASKRNCAVVVACGNEANAGHHFSGKAQSVLSPVRAEINVEKDIDGFVLELVTVAPEIVTVAVQSPTGEIWPRGVIPAAANQSYLFLFEGTTVSIDYQNVGRNRKDILTFFRFQNVKRGIWTILVYPYNVINGNFDMWLAMREQQLGNVYFLNSNPFSTLTSPSDARAVLSVGGYDSTNGAVYLDSGRGYPLDGIIKPDLLAPAVNVEGKNERGNLARITGTSAAAAITAGACAQVLEWGVVRRNAEGMNTLDIKNLLIRGAVRQQGQEYPSPTTGYGRLNVYQSFEQMRGNQLQE